MTLPSATRRPSTLASLLLAGAALVWAVVRSAPDIWQVQAEAIHYAAIWPQRAEDPLLGYYSDSPLGWIVFQRMPSQSLWWFVVLGGLAGLLATVLIAWWAWRLAADEHRWMAARLSILAPVATVVFASIGSYDAYTMLVWALCLFALTTGRWWWAVGAGMLLGFQHFEQGILGVGALWLCWVAMRSDLPARITRLSPLWLVPGVLVGKLVLFAVMVSANGTVESRSAWVGGLLREWTTNAISLFPLLLWSLFAGTWAVVISYFWTRPPGRARYLLVAAFAVGLLASAISADRPRTFIMVMAPAVALLIVAYSRTEIPRSSQGRLVEVIVWLAPPVLFWGKQVFNEDVFNPLYTTLQHLLHGF